MKRIVQAFHHMFLCIGLISIGMSSLMGAAKDPVEESIKNVLRELATAYNKDAGKDKAQDALKDLLLEHKEINKDLKFEHITYKEKSSPWYSMFGSGVDELKTDISLSVIMFALIYVPKSLTWFNELESENKDMLFVISDEQKKYLYLLLENNLKVDGVDKETLKKRLADWMSWQEIRTDLKALSIDKFEELDKDGSDQKINEEEKKLNELINAMDEDNRYPFIKKSVDDAVKKIKDEYHKQSVKGKLERFKEIQEIKDFKSKTSSEVAGYIEEVGAMQGVLKINSKAAEMAKVLERLDENKDLLEAFENKLKEKETEKEKAEAARIEASKKKKEEKARLAQEAAEKKAKAKEQKRLTREEEKKKQQEELDRLKAELEEKKKKEKERQETEKTRKEQLSRFEEIKKMSFSVGTESATIDKLISEISGMNGLLKNENDYKNNKEDLLKKLTKKMNSLKAQEEYWGKKLREDQKEKIEELNKQLEEAKRQIVKEQGEKANVEKMILDVQSKRQGILAGIQAGNKNRLKKVEDSNKKYDAGKKVALRSSGEVALSGSHVTDIRDAARILGIAEGADLSEALVDQKFREIIKRDHPDRRVNQNHPDRSSLSFDMSPLKQARDFLLKEIGEPTSVLPPRKSINVSGQITFQGFDRQKIAKGLRSDYIQNTFGNRINAENQINQGNFKQKIENEMLNVASIRSSREQLASTIKRPIGPSGRRPRSPVRSMQTKSLQKKVDADAGERLWDEKYKPLKEGSHVAAMIKGEPKRWPAVSPGESLRDQQMSRKPAIVTSKQVEKLRKEEKRKEELAIIKELDEVNKQISKVQANGLRSLGTVSVGDLSSDKQIDTSKKLETKIKEIVRDQNVEASKSPSSPRLSPIRFSIDERSRAPQVRSQTPGRRRSLDDSDVASSSKKPSEYLDIAEHDTSRISGQRPPRSTLRLSASTPRSTPRSPLSTPRSPLSRMYDFSKKSDRDLAVKGLRDGELQKGLYALCKEFQKPITSERLKNILSSPVSSFLASPDWAPFASLEDSRLTDLMLSSPDMSPASPFSSPKKKVQDDKPFSLPASASPRSLSNSLSSAFSEKKVTDYFTFDNDAFERMMRSE